MFDAARAALLSDGIVAGKTHRGLINLFSEHWIKTERFPKEEGRALKHAETIRYIADYEGDSVSLTDAQDILSQAERFVLAVKGHIEEDSL